MQSLPLVRHILRDEAVTRGLGDMEARMIVEWLADGAEQVADEVASDEAGWVAVRDLCRRARTIAYFVRLWGAEETRGAAMQLAATEKLFWPLPAGTVEAGELMEGILAWVDRQDEIRAESFARRVAA